MSALNKYWRPITEDEYWDKMDMIDVNNAITSSAMPKEIQDWIWEKKRKLGEVFK